MWLSAWAIALFCMVGIAGGLALAAFIRRRNTLQQIQENETRLKLSLWASGDLLWDWQIDTPNLFCQNDWLLIKQFPQDGIREQQTTTPIHEHDTANVRDQLIQHLNGHTEFFEATYRVRDIQGNWRWLLDRGKVVERNAAGEALRMTGTIKDVHELVVAQERVRLFAASFTNISDGVCIYDHEFNAVEVNDAFVRITGITREQSLGRPFQLVLYSEQFTAHIKEQLSLLHSWRGEVDDVRANGDRYTIDISIDAIRTDDGNITHYVVSFADITERKSTENELRRLANTDTLTGLPNRSYFQVHHSAIVRKRIPHALLVFDLDNFKKINDSLSHDIGDLLLCLVAERISSVLTSRDSLYRLGGDEFAIIVESTIAVSAVAKIANAIVSTLHNPFQIEAHEFVVNGSLGVVLYPNDGDSSLELLQNADTAMYHAKYRGGNIYQFFSDSMNQAAVSRLHIENQLRQALKNNLLHIHYQPKINLITQRVEGYEALARIHTLEGVQLSPSDFIPLAEETGMIIELGQRVLEQACHDAKQWREQGLFMGRVAVNLSARQFNQTDFVLQVEQALQKTQLPAHALELEITESMVMSDPEKSIAIMSKLNTLGIHLALDDFGTGYSSLAYLKRFPIHCLKIDKAFIDDIHTCARERNMVASIISMAHNLGLKVVAEGVEEAEQVAVLQSLQCETAQGYFYSRPLSKLAFEAFIASTLSKQ
ncbi:putative bifunctional diguanylate cyclase/phosphodiesterase [Aliidiomarina quisquiliarum]|uniref:putative bifunctional diguanylate cyclase/phosphodiesterase n=1 Tax=Aliidiomarina quisquiliarum TaxID=2938947 RepID=UPI00208F3329|nr:EAL domain-containing protein [Aliidiomarina quisquiliarum]MCO4321997.1 EAL domain-containing protein [Aliidiomarina quisquiliarum]